MKSYKDYTDIVFQEKMVELDTGIKMAYYEFGMENPVPLLLLHGITDGCVSWTQMIPELTGRGYHLYIIEYRGNGMTDKPEADECGYTAEMIAEDIINWMDKTGIKQIHLVGHSYGSMISQVLAARYPERFLTCILMDTGVECKGDLIALAKEGDGKFLGMDAYEEYLPEDFCEEWMATSNEDPDFRESVAAHLKQMPAAAFRNLIHGLEHYDGNSWLSMIKAPVSIVWGAEDDVFTASDQEDVKQALGSGNIDWVEVPGASHNGFWDSKARAGEYSAIIDRCIKRNDL